MSDNLASVCSVGDDQGHWVLSNGPMLRSAFSDPFSTHKFIPFSLRPWGCKTPYLCEGMWGDCPLPALGCDAEGRLRVQVAPSFFHV